MNKEIIYNEVIFRVCVNHYPDIAVSKNGEIYCMTNKCIMPYKNWKTKYRCVTSRYLNGKIFPVPIHRAVALYWVENDDLINKNTVNHINHNKNDNRAENLEWCTHKQNIEAFKLFNKNKKQNIIRI